MDYVDKIRDVQRAEGNQPCFRSGRPNCGYKSVCVWAEICYAPRLHVFTVKNKLHSERK